MVGKWEAVANWPAVAVHVIHLRNGKLLFWAYGSYDPQRTQDVYLYDIATGQMTGPFETTHLNAFCAGHSQPANGDVLVVGGSSFPFGHNNFGSGHKLSDLWLTRSSAWKSGFSPMPDMVEARWYPTCPVLPNGKLLVIGGVIFNVVNPPDSIPAKHLDLYDPTTASFSQLGGPSFQRLVDASLHVRLA